MEPVTVMRISASYLLNAPAWNAPEAITVINGILFRFGNPLACLRLSDSEEDAKEKGTRKVGGAGTLLSPVSSRVIFAFALFQKSTKLMTT